MTATTLGVQPEHVDTPHASSTVALRAATLRLTDAKAELDAVDLRSLKGPFRQDVKAAREAVDKALKTSKR